MTANRIEVLLAMQLDFNSFNVLDRLEIQARPAQARPEVLSIRLAPNAAA
jgi:hypothetical protein